MTHRRVHCSDVSSSVKGRRCRPFFPQIMTAVLLTVKISQVVKMVSSNLQFPRKMHTVFCISRGEGRRTECSVPTGPRSSCADLWVGLMEGRTGSWIFSLVCMDASADYCGDDVVFAAKLPKVQTHSEWAGSRQLFQGFQIRLHLLLQASVHKWTGFKFKQSL